jgi:tartrate dehydratase beta subunit/fumarate hydratase class I family protein
VRLISNRVLIDGKEYRYRDILKDSLLHTLLSYETAPFTIVSYLEKPD